MKRREFSGGLIATTLAGTAVSFPKRSLASQRDNERDELAALARITLLILTQTIILSSFIIANPGGFLGLSLLNPVPQSKANRAAVNKLPVLGQLFRPTIAQQLSGAFLVGFLVLVGTALILMARNRPIRNVKKVVIVHGDIAYEPKIPPKPVTLSKIPQLGELMKRKRVGDAYQKGENLIILVRPTIVDDQF